MDVILGIDLGTTNSAVAVIRNEQVEVLREDGEAILPSVVGLDNEGRLLVGLPARNQWVLAPERTVRSIKRQMGEDITVQLGEQNYSPQEISAIILRTLKERAERQLGHECRKAVITVPAFFTEQQREATREAGELAGLEVARIINEPTAASLTYESDLKRLERLLVYDLGGGTFDVSLVQVEQGVVEVLASHGDTHLGGDDFDQLLMDHVCDRFAEEHGVDLRESLVAKSRVLQAVEEAKKKLSFEAFARVQEEFLAEKDGLPLHLDMELSRLEYEELIAPLLEKTLRCLDQSLEDGQVRANQIDKVILVGGASRTPLVHRLLQDRLQQPLHSEVDPDLCVAMGAAIQGGMIAGVEVGPVLVDITPRTLGVQCLGSLYGVPSIHCFSPIIERNTPLPASRSEVYTTSVDNQEQALIAVHQGEHEDVRNNEPVGEFYLEGLADVERGNEILVRFDLDLDGILTVTGTERATGLENRLTIDNPMARFRMKSHEEAQARLEAAFQTQAGGQAAAAAAAAVATPQAEQLPEHLQQAIAKAETLIAKGEQLAPQASDEDAEEIHQLVQKLLRAIAHRSQDQLENSMSELEDLVFYLQDTA